MGCVQSLAARRSAGERRASAAKGAKGASVLQATGAAMRRHLRKAASGEGSGHGGGSGGEAKPKQETPKSDGGEEQRAKEDKVRRGRGERGRGTRRDGGVGGKGRDGGR